MDTVLDLVKLIGGKYTEHEGFFTAVFSNDHREEILAWADEHATSAVEVDDRVALYDSPAGPFGFMDPENNGEWVPDEEDAEYHLWQAYLPMDPEEALTTLQRLTGQMESEPAEPDEPDELPSTETILARLRRV